MSSETVGHVTAEDELNKHDGNILINNGIYGAIAVVPVLAILDEMGIRQIKIASYLLAASLLTSGVSTFIGSSIRRRPFIRSAIDAILAMGCYALGGIVPFLCGTLIHRRLVRNFVLFGVTTLIFAFIVMIDFYRKKDKQQRPKAKTYWILGVFIVLSVAVVVFFADQAKLLRSACKKK